MFDPVIKGGRVIDGTGALEATAELVALAEIIKPHGGYSSRICPAPPGRAGMKNSTL